MSNHASDDPKPRAAASPRIDPRRVAELHNAAVAAEQENATAQAALTSAAEAAVATAEKMHATRIAWRRELSAYHRQKVADGSTKPTGPGLCGSGLF